MATYDNDLRLKEITTGDEDGTWGTSTNTNLELIADSFSYGTKAMPSNANTTFTMADAASDTTRSFYLKITSAVSLTATRTVTLGPNTISKVWLIENATTGGQSIIISQGSGANVTVPNGSKVFIATDGNGVGAAVYNANPTAATVNLTSDVTGTLPVANGGTGVTSSTGTGSVVRSSVPTITNLVFNGKYTEDIYALVGTTLDPDFGTVQTKTLSGNTTFSDSVGAGESMILMLNAGASYTVTWPTITWVTSAGNAAPTLTANDTFVFWKISSTLYGAYTGSYA
jgi:hypothetical protein